MNTTEFRENFEIDATSKRGVKARQKNGAKPLPEVVTADGAVFNPEEKYFFFDRDNAKVRETIGLRRIDADFLGSFGLRVVQISNLRVNRADALADGIEFFKSQISELNKLIAGFETEKAAENNRSGN